MSLGMPYYKTVLGPQSKHIILTLHQEILFLHVPF